ncbi:MAG: amidohydrolase [Chthoniobacterales bacterium]
MRNILLPLVLVLVLVPPRAQAEVPQFADTIFINGNVYTVNDKAPHATAIAIKGERILFAGSNDEAKKYSGPATRTIDLAGKTVVPGLTDSHYHIFGVGERLIHLNLEAATSRELFLETVKRQTEKSGTGRWITGRGWIETFWKPPVFPTRDDLDKVAPANPVFLVRADGHGAIANSKALALAGIDAKTPDPFGGKIVRDEKTAEPTGMLLDNAMELVAKKIPATSAAEMERALSLGAQHSVEVGWCEIQNPGSYVPEVAIMQKLYGEGKIKLRIYNAVWGPGPDAEKLLKDGPILDAFDHHFTTRAIKVIFDGSLGSRSAALLEPYADAKTSGFLTQKPEELRPMFREALRQGIQVETHAIGDRANHTILDLYEEAFQAVPPDERKVKEPRWRVEHAQILTPNDLPRFAKLHVIASMQPSHAISDFFFAPRRLGERRLKGAYAWQSLIKSGAIVTAGSDAPVEKGEPMIEFYAAIARKSINGFSAPDWHPEEKVSRQQALEMLTRWPAYTAFQENEKGSIEPGKFADLTILSGDIMKIPEPEILRTRCLMTVIGGEIAYDTGEIAHQ